ncbi:MAG: hypothetical protein PWQ12_135 [Clostridiales bacterium]|jgi:methyl-accepting chemotaxis protein|nr:hypothetical protein [Clostridiales bacterium]
MDSQLVITLKDFLLFILWAGLAVIFIYLILILSRALRVMKQINLIVEDNRKSIDDTLEVVPDLTKNIEAISGEISHDIAAFRDSVDNVAETAGSVTDTLKKNKGAIEALSSFLHTVSVGKVLYDKYFKEKVDDVKDAADAVQETMDEAEH